MEIKFILPKLTFWLFRFKTLARVKRIFSNIESPCFMRCSLFNHDFYLDVSRGVTHQLLFLEGERFVQERFLISKLLKPGMRVVDVGANIGYYMLLFEKHVGPEGEVVCIEPSPENLPELKRNIKSNRFDNVKLFETALGMEDGDTGLHEGINSGIVEKGHGAYQVSIRKLDSLIKGKVDFLKIDVEGYEGQVLRGASEIINRDKPLLFLELHPYAIPKFGFSVKQILDDLSKIYKKIDVYVVPPNETTSFIKKVLVRYFGNDNLLRINNIKQFIAKYPGQGMPYTFWIVCRS